jgi:hypothetical protein
MKKGTYFFVNKKIHNKHSMIKLQETHSESNPIAKIPIETITKKRV